MQTIGLVSTEHYNRLSTATQYIVDVFLQAHVVKILMQSKASAHLGRAKTPSNFCSGNGLDTSIHKWYIEVNTCRVNEN
jgi:hypothetical protein